MLIRLSIYLLLLILVASCATSLPIDQLAALTTCKSVEQNHSSIVGGKAVLLNDPDQQLVAMIKIRKNNHESICTGTLISNRVVLTAAHCTANVKASNIQVEFITSSGCPVDHVRKESVEVKNVKIHPHFDGSPKSLADLSLLYLTKKAPSDQVRVPLLQSKNFPQRSKVLLIGYGITNEVKKDSMVLRRIYKNLKNDLTFRGKALIVDQRSGSGGFCRGDSGAPIITEVWGEPYILAVNSANIGVKPQTECQTLSLALDITHFADWVLKNQKKLEDSSWLSQIF